MTQVPSGVMLIDSFAMHILISRGNTYVYVSIRLFNYYCPG